MNIRYGLALAALLGSIGFVTACSEPAQQGAAETEAAHATVAVERQRQTSGEQTADEPRVTGPDASTAQVDAKPESIGMPETPRGPHGSHDPHGALGPEAMIKVALQHYQEGRPGEALKTLDEAIGRDERNPDLRVVRASLLLLQKEVARALEDLELAAKWRPDDAQVYINRAQAYRQFGRPAEALADLDKAIELQPDLLAARFNRGAMLHAQGDYAGALLDFDHCVAVDPHTAAPYFNRASTYEALGRRAEAVADLERFMELVDNEQWKQTAQKLLDTWQGNTDSAGATAGQGEAANRSGEASS
jgi:tetratricopeptide (TPR) repeat protein